jgi:cytochrome c oxidase subunit IV
MSIDLQTHTGTPTEPHHQSHEHTHPSDKMYIIIAIVLAVITAAEVATYVWEDWFEEAGTGVLIATLFPMMIAKFAIVCGWFMHLKYDNPIFRRIFVFGLVLAVVVFMAAMTSMQLFGASDGGA